MTTPVIGLESMPNVYFNSVEISNDKLQILLSMKDFKENPTWHNSTILRDTLKIKIISLSFNKGPPGSVPPIDLEMKRFADGLKSGDLSIHEFDYISNTKVFAAQNFNEDRTFETDDGILNFYYNIEFTSEDFTLDKQNIFVFALAYIDLTTLNLNYANYKYLDGPMASETIKEDNVSPLNATLFKLPDGTIWSGPVHQHEDGFMEGSFHKEEPHSELTQDTVDSKSKITEFIEDVITEVSPPLSRAKSQSPDLNSFYHIETENESSFCIVDGVNLALNQLQSARELFNTNQEYFYELMKDFPILQFEVRKAPVKNRLDFIDIGTRDWAYDYTKESVLARTIMTDGQFEERYEMRFFSQQYNVDPNKLVESDNNQFDIKSFSSFEASKKIGYIKPLPSNEEFLYNLLIVNELYYTEEKEDYRLKLTFDIIDSFKNKLLETKKEIDDLIVKLNMVYNGLFGRLDKERIINFFAQSGIALDTNLAFVSIVSESNFNTSIFAETKKVLKNALLALVSNNDRIEDMSNKIVSSLYINSSSKENFNNVSKFLSNLSNKISTKYNLQVSNTNSRIGSSGAIRVEKIVDKVVAVNNIKEGAFDYFDKQIDNRILNSQDVLSRSDQEFNKFFTRNIESREILQISPDLGNESAQQMVDFNSVKYAFFTPVSYNFADQKMDLSQADMSIFDEKKHDLISNHMFEVKSRAKATRRSGLPKSRKKLSRSSRRGKKKLLSTIGISRAFKKSSAQGEDLKFENVEEYLGSTSLFLKTNLGTRRKQIERSENPSNLIRKTFSQDRKIKKFKNIAIDNEESFLLKNKNKINFANLPFQFRALVLSNYGLSRFSFPLEEEQLLENPRFSTAINNIFSRIKVAQYLDGFDVSDSGLRNLNNPIYKILTIDAIESGKTLMIKMNNFKNEFLQIEEEDNIPSFNTLFVIESSIQPTSLAQPESFLVQPTDWKEKEFSTTNILNQNQKRKELTKFVKNEALTQPSVSPQVNSTTSLRPTRSGRGNGDTARVTPRSTTSATAPTTATRVPTSRGSSGGSSGGGY